MTQAEAQTSRMEASWHRILHREEQRASARHVALLNTAWIAWEGAAGRVITENGTLLDISRGGARIQVGLVPPDRTLWLCIEAADKVWGCRFEMIDHQSKGPIGTWIRGRFPNSCPEPFFRVALRGHREKSPPHARPAKSTGVLHWVKSRIGRQPDPAPEPAPNVAALRERAVRRLAAGEVEVGLIEPVAAPEIEVRATTAPVGIGKLSLKSLSSVIPG